MKHLILVQYNQISCVFCRDETNFADVEAEVLSVNGGLSVGWEKEFSGLHIHSH